jgi:Prokaryotic Cytochrome C oxidase subunit IV
MLAISSYKTKDLVWLALMTMTLASALIAESAEPSFWVTLAIATTVMIKGRLVINRFMELHNAHAYVRFSMNLYFYVLPLMIFVVYLFPEFIADLTRMSE